MCICNVRWGLTIKSALCLTRHSLIKMKNFYRTSTSQKCFSFYLLLSLHPRKIFIIQMPVYNLAECFGEGVDNIAFMAFSVEFN